MALARATMCDSIIALLKASAKANLAAVDDNAIQFGTRKFGQIFALQFGKGILVGLGGGSVAPLTMGAEKQDVVHNIEIVVYTIGHDPDADLRLVVSILEEIEEILWASATMTLTGGGTITGEPSVAFGPPVAGSDMTLHWAVMQLSYRKTGTL